MTSRNKRQDEAPCFCPLVSAATGYFRLASPKNVVGDLHFSRFSHLEVACQGLRHELKPMGRGSSTLYWPIDLICAAHYLEFFRD